MERGSTQTSEDRQLAPLVSGAIDYAIFMLGLDSGQGTGSRFWFTLPRAG